MKKSISVCVGVLLALATTLAFGCSDNQLEANKRTITQFYNAAINQKDFTAASVYLDPAYRQHNPKVADGVSGLKAFIQLLSSKYPKAHSEIKKIIAEDDYVVLHVHSIREPGTSGRAIVDIFKLKNGKIIEHWDVIQDIPEKAGNSNGMF